MAEFVDVMKMARRMCKSIDDCGDCPIFTLCYFDKYLKEYNGDLVQQEAAIIKWDAENPELRYPTWREWHSMNFPDAEDYITPCGFIPRQKVEALMGNKCIDLDCSQCIKLPIPADIAKKLGIQPITKANDTTTKEASQ